MDTIPDYSSYSLEDLYDVAKHINREKYPDRFEMVIQEIIRRKQGHAAQTRSQTEQTYVAQTSTGNIFVSFLSAIASVLIWASVGCVFGAFSGFIILMLVLSLGPQNNLDAATGMGGRAMVLFGLIGSILGAVAGIKHTSR